MSIKELTTKVAEETGFTKKDTEETIRVTFDTITNLLSSGEDVSIPGFGKFDVVTRAARVGRNPQTGVAIEIPETKVPKFKPSSNLKSLFKN